MTDTTGKVANFAPPAVLDPSGRLTTKENLFSPFTFSQSMSLFTNKLFPRNYDDFQSCVSFSHLRLLGRPLWPAHLACPPYEIVNFAIEKLRCSLDATNSKNWILDTDLVALSAIVFRCSIGVSAYSLAASYLVMRHMGTCTSISDDRSGVFVKFTWS